MQYSLFRPITKRAASTSASGQVHVKDPSTGHNSSSTSLRMADTRRLVQISKDMSRILRHHPPPGSMDVSGWMSLPVLIANLRSKPSVDEVRQVVETNDKKRFVLDEDSDPPKIRAAQGHSVDIAEPVFVQVLQAETVPVAIHHTSSEGWQAIQQSGELRRMARTHIHFATEPHHLRRNKWANVLLRLHLKDALAAGHKFYLSTNHVLLCEGPLPVQYVTAVDMQQLPEDWSTQLTR
eukprot:jgi/Chrzof1/844/Cz01g31040.t1